MEKVVRIIKKDKAEEADINFWKNKSGEERLSAVQHLRERWIEKFHNKDQYHESRKRLRRFYKIVKRKWGQIFNCRSFCRLFSCPSPIYRRYSFFIDNNPKNIKNLLKALEQFGFGSLDISEEDFSKDSMLQLGYEPNRIDVLTDISGVWFEPAWENKVKAHYGNQPSYFISIDDLIANKKASNRTKDKSDLELLEKFRK